MVIGRYRAERVSCSLFFFSSRRRHTRLQGDWSSDVCSSDLATLMTPSLPIAADRAATCRVAAHPSARLRREASRLCPGLRNVRSRRGERGEPRLDRKSVVEGKSVDLGGGRIIKKKKKKTHGV